MYLWRGNGYNWRTDKIFNNSQKFIASKFNKNLCQNSMHAKLLCNVHENSKTEQKAALHTLTTTTAATTALQCSALLSLLLLLLPHLYLLISRSALHVWHIVFSPWELQNWAESWEQCSVLSTTDSVLTVKLGACSFFNSSPHPILLINHQLARWSSKSA